MPRSRWVVLGAIVILAVAGCTLSEQVPTLAYTPQPSPPPTFEPEPTFTTTLMPAATSAPTVTPTATATLLTPTMVQTVQVPDATPLGDDGVWGYCETQIALNVRWSTRTVCYDVYDNAEDCDNKVGSLEAGQVVPFYAAKYAEDYTWYCLLKDDRNWCKEWFAAIRWNPDQFGEVVQEYCTVITED